MAMIGKSAYASEQMDVQQDGRWSVVVSPYIWAASLSGHGAFGPNEVPARVSFPTIVSNLDLAVMGEVEVTNGRYGVYFDGQYTNAGKDASIGGLDARFATTSKMITVGGFFRAATFSQSGLTRFGHSREISIEPTFGFRWTQLIASVTPMVGQHTSNWIDPFIGLRVNADLSERWTLFSEADIGGFGAGSRFSTNLQVYAGYRMFLFKQPAIFRVGYRAWYQDYAHGDGGDRFSWRVTQHGPVVGLSTIF
ncbi:hypothetical protein PAN31117_04662 [Pandoraea anapnoica]|uniref:Outer membrane protein beta-barrel domain-containing protein n=2 Tax=Burkholderiaceae TaxID=119060 RepID=A0A5E5AKV1_9BURK|nr:hypothetical protein PAN31117_04662 [Pandoraea anapnoica]